MSSWCPVLLGFSRLGTEAGQNCFLVLYFLQLFLNFLGIRNAIGKHTVGSEIFQRSLHMRNSRSPIILPQNKMLQTVWSGKSEKNSCENKQNLHCLCILMAAGKPNLEQNPGAQTQLQTDLKKFQDVYNPALRSASFHWLTSLSKSGKLAGFGCISLSANPLPHFKIQPSKAAMLLQSEHQL